MNRTERAIALGAFDGLHIGHAEVIAKAVQRTDLIPSLLTFREDPSKSLTGYTEYLLTEEEKESTLAKMGIQDVFALDFAQVRNLPPEYFVSELLQKEYCAKSLVCGESFRFGKGATGDTALLSALCDRLGMELTIVSSLMIEGEPVSSTRIRTAIRNGQLALATALLGRRFGFSFAVVEGNRIGRTLGTPTINQRLPEGFVKPKFGVYASLVYVDGKQLCGVTNVGIKPTVGTYDPLFETWIPNFEKDMYGQKIRVELVEFIRSEKKFASLDALREEIHANADKAQQICARLQD